MDPKRWIIIDESARDMLARCLTDHPFLLCPPLNRVPLRVGNVVEIVGSSPTSKTKILIQATTSCILPKVWNGIYYGGLERVAMYIDLDCTFDIGCLAHSLKHLIMSPPGLQNVDSSKCNNQTRTVVSWDEDLFSTCMQRFFYVRCYNSMELLATLKTLYYQFQANQNSHGPGLHFLIIDNIGAFHWMDRSPMSFTKCHTKKMPSVQCIFETVVKEIQKLLSHYPTLVLVTRATILGHNSAVEASRRMVKPILGSTTVYVGNPKLSSLKWSMVKQSHLKCEKDVSKLAPYREYMPYIWQSFVTHRAYLWNSEGGVLSSRWLLPSLDVVDEIVIV